MRRHAWEKAADLPANPYRTKSRSCVIAGGLAYRRLEPGEVDDGSLDIQLALDLLRASPPMQDLHDRFLKAGTRLAEHCTLLDSNVRMQTGAIPYPIVDVLSGTILLHDQQVLGAEHPWDITVLMFQ